MKIKVAPSILASDFSAAGQTFARLEQSGADLAHCDVMDGNFVPPITFGAQFIQHIRPHTKLFLDCHLMTLHPETHIESFAAAGADLISVHTEVCGKRTGEVLRAIRALGVKAAAVVNPATPVTELFDWLGDVDMYLVMSVVPGWGGQKFIPESLKKLEELRAFCIKNGRPDLDIEVDGGVTEQNAGDIAAAGANVLVAGSTVFRSADMRATIEALRRA
ncbi:MAG: ribulose-phosphate 3-epimerase [Clostridia bacterium]|jgi:ribulose-phosphate 3-epimerase|nr:ribulose-phosphate 3-epimerase [Clostridia bacterium]